MLDKLRDEALAQIAATPRCTLSTSGPAGVQASMVACHVRDTCIYVLVPSTADHLFNLEYSMEVVLTAALWCLDGAALGFRTAADPYAIASRAMRDRTVPEGHTLVEVFPIRIHLEAAGERRYRETIDFDARAQIRELAQGPSPAYPTSLGRGDS
jgi:hypothetical protein